MPQQSIVSRFAISLVANILRSGLSIIAGLLVARSLGPSEYGGFTFLISTLTVMRQLLDMGSSTAFYTFISQRSRGRRFFGLYAGWQLAQLIVPLFLVALLLPEHWIHLIWLGHDRGIILLALLAAFTQQQLWSTAVQIGESRRLTLHVQVFGVGVALAHLVFVAALHFSGWISQTALFVLLATEYLIAAVLLYRAIGIPTDPTEAEPTWRAIYNEYWVYCRPLILSSWVGFASGFADNWILQRFGGATEQAYFAVSYQLSTACVLATNSLLQIFWKEIAVSYQDREMERARVIFEKSSRLLLLTGAATGSFLIPWSREIVLVLLGGSYLSGWPILALLLFFPIHTTLAQTLGPVYFATNNSRSYSNILVISMVIGIPLTYLIIAPHDATHFGLGLGGEGRAIKLILMQIITVNVLWWWICRSLRWNYNWSIQLVVPGICLGVSLALHVPARLIWSGGVPEGIAFFGGTLILFVCTILGIVWRWPQLVGGNRSEFEQLLNRVFPRVIERLTR